MWTGRRRVRYTGIAAVARSANGHWLGWQSRQMDCMTNNEAEYLAALLGLELAGELGARRVIIVTDSNRRRVPRCRARAGC